MIKVGLIAGSFDIIHPGYIRLFKDAKKVCSYLIIALQEDPSIERPKTKTKPIFTKEERLEILMSIRYIDDVRFYKTENDLVLMLLEIEPDIRIIGSDYAQGVITGRSISPLYFHARDHEWSMTKVRKLICEEKK
jgi:glycerol-3-phosphate cytidylyltransferase